MYASDKSFTHKDTNSTVIASDQDIRATCEAILASTLFANSLRMKRLLRFLVDKAITGNAQDTSEYNIGIEVFDRDPAIYSTGDDPIVRVQIGRLREKLKTYYATIGINADIEISIPVGGYMPLIQRRNIAKTDAKTNSHVVAIFPFRCISHQGSGENFTLGIYDDLTHQLFKQLGAVTVAHSFFSPENATQKNQKPENASATNVIHWLEGSIQIEADLMRASIRLVDASTGCIALSEQFNRDASFAIALQEELASSICNALQRFFLYE